MNKPNYEFQSVDAIPRESRRGHGFHIFLATVGVAMALGIYIASATGFIDDRASMLIVLCLGMIALPLVFMDPVHGLVVYALLAPISLEFEVSGIEMRVHDPLAVLILIGIIIQALKSSKRYPRLRGKKVLVLYAAAALCLTALAMLTRVRAGSGQISNMFHALKVVQYVVIAIAAGLSIRTHRDLRLVIGAFIVGMILLSAQLSWNADHVIGRTTGVAVNEKANVLSVYLAVACAVVLGCADRVRDRMLMAGLIVLLIVAAYAMLLTKSRSGYASLGVVLLVSLFTMRRKVIPLGVLALGGIAFFLKDDLFARAQSLGAVVGIGEDSSFEARKVAYSLIWRQTTGNPIAFLFGAGRGSEDLGYADTQWGIELLYGGVIGFAVCVTMIGSALWFSYRTFKTSRTHSPTLAAASTAAFLAMVAASISTFGLTSWSSIRLAEAIFIMIGVSMAADRIMRRERQRLGPIIAGAKDKDVPADAMPANATRKSTKFDY